MNATSSQQGDRRRFVPVVLSKSSGLIFVVLKDSSGRNNLQFFRDQSDDRIRRLWKNLAQVDLLIIRQDILQCSHENIFSFRRQVDLRNTALDGAAQLGVRDAGTAMQHEGGWCGMVNSLKQFKLQFRRLFVESMC